MFVRIVVFVVLLLASFSDSAPTPTPTPTPTSTAPDVAPTAIPIPISGTESEGKSWTTTPAPGVQPKAASMGCFPRSATVELEVGSMREMSALEVGDWVRTGAGFSEVFMFSHRVDSGKHEFVEIVTEGGVRIRLTSEHLLMVNSSLREAGSVVLGDVLTLADGAATSVVSVGLVWEGGLYNPHTTSGYIVVNGVLASTYTRNVPAEIAHAALTPLRALWRRFSLYTDALDDPVELIEGASWVSSFVRRTLATSN